LSEKVSLGEAVVEGELLVTRSSPVGFVSAVVEGELLVTRSSPVGFLSALEQQSRSKPV